jgi:SAM-dependent methyltransferase
MKERSPMNPEFDAYAEGYDAALGAGLSVSGEGKEFFARGRVAWTARCLAGHGERPRAVMDFGCGTGTSVPLLRELVGAETVVGVDVSEASLDVARGLHGSPSARYATLSGYEPCGEIDLAFCNGVFHHIPPAMRAGAIQYIYRSLRPGGLFALWENNPWNLGTRYVMSRIPFDRGAITLTPPEARRMLAASAFEVLATHFIFIFPRALRWLRGLEPLVARLPLGAQYQVLCRKPPPGQGTDRVRARAGGRR